MQPIVNWVETQALTRPQHIAVITGSSETTYQDLWAQVKTAAAWYQVNGVSVGDSVLISTDSRDPYFVPAYFGAHLARAIAVPVPFRMSESEIEHRSKVVASKLNVLGERLLELRELLSCSSTAQSSDREFEAPELSDIAEIMFTTGSTGEPKGVTLSHGNIAASAELIRKFVRNADNDREVVTVPLSHSFGLGRLRSNVLAGGTIIIVPGLTFPQLTIRALEDHAATGLACVPTGMTLLMSKFEPTLRRLSDQLRYVEMGSMQFPKSYKDQLRDILPTSRLCMHYGLTEASRSTFLEFHTDREHLKSVGKPSPGVEIAILSESKSPVPVGAQGLIHIRAATVMQGYWQNSTRTDEALDRDTGWFNSGDLGYEDADGYIYFLGRSDDVINTGGVKILPDAIEDQARDFTGVKDCGCVGMPDPDGILGEVPILFVTSDSSSLDLTKLSRFLHDRLGGEVPTISIRLIEKMPRTASGKLLRRELRSALQN